MLQHTRFFFVFFKAGCTCQLFCSIWLVKVCQWVTLTPVQGCREGGAGELGHMVALATRNSHCETSPLNHWRLQRSFFLVPPSNGVWFICSVAQKQTSRVASLNWQKKFTAGFEEEKSALLVSLKSGLWKLAASVWNDIFLPCVIISSLVRLSLTTHRIFTVFIGFWRKCCSLKANFLAETNQRLSSCWTLK